MKIKLKQGQIKEFESTKEELARLKDDYSMAKISLESKQQKLNEAKNQVKQNIIFLNSWVFHDSQNPLKRH